MIGYSLQRSVKAQGKHHLYRYFCWRRMRRKVEKNATSLARRFRNLAGLKLLLLDEMRSLELAKRKAMSVLDEISEACSHRPQTLVEQASSDRLCHDRLPCHMRLPQEAPLIQDHVAASRTAMHLGHIGWLLLSVVSMRGRAIGIQEAQYRIVRPGLMSAGGHLRAVPGGAGGGGPRVPTLPHGRCVGRLGDPPVPPGGARHGRRWLRLT